MLLLLDGIAAAASVSGIIHVHQLHAAGDQSLTRDYKGRCI